MVWVFSSLGRDHVVLVTHGLSGLQLAVLENNGCISEDEVNGAGDEGVTVELSVTVGVKSVLVGVNVAPVYHRQVCTDTECHGLVLLWARCVLEPDVLSYKPITNRSCKATILCMRLLSLLSMYEANVLKQPTSPPKGPKPIA